MSDNNTEVDTRFQTKLITKPRFFLSEGLSLAPVGASRSIKDGKFIFLEYSLLRGKIGQYFCTIITNLILHTHTKNSRRLVPKRAYSRVESECRVAFDASWWRWRDLHVMLFCTTVRVVYVKTDYPTPVLEVWPVSQSRTFIWPNWSDFGQ